MNRTFNPKEGLIPRSLLRNKLMTNEVSLGLIPRSLLRGVSFGTCYPEEHYMVDMERRLKEIEKLVDDRKYFTINRARQYGKTTLLNLMVQRLSSKYLVFSVSFEGLGDSAFEKEASFCGMICKLLYDAIRYDEVPAIEDSVKNIIYEAVRDNRIEDLFALSAMISEICSEAGRPVVLMIDEVDQASGHKVFLDFLGMLRSKYLKRTTRPVFQSVILAGVYDIKNLRQRIRKDEEHQYNSPWNIAADFCVDMSFTEADIAGMLQDYAADRNVEMEIHSIAAEIYGYTSGYPYLVSKICKLIDENRGNQTAMDSWSKESVTEAVKVLLKEPGTLFDDMRKKITDYPELRKIIYAILFRGEAYPYNLDNFAIDIGAMFGFIADQDGQAVIANRIFETRLYNLFLSEEMTKSITYQTGELEKNQFIKNGMLDMELVLKKFMWHFHDVYGKSTVKFVEENGRRIFLLYLKPIINGVGNYYIEAQTRDQTRTDVIVDYMGKQFVIEVKIWRGDAYNRRGEKQLTEYLDYYHLNYGYLLSFNFNKNKKIEMKEIIVGDRTILEVVV